jgi:hypothetical protein
MRLSSRRLAAIVILVCSATIVAQERHVTVTADTIFA